MKNISFILSEDFQFLEVKFSLYLNRHVSEIGCSEMRPDLDPFCSQNIRRYISSEPNHLRKKKQKQKKKKNRKKKRDASPFCKCLLVSLSSIHSCLSRFPSFKSVIYYSFNNVLIKSYLINHPIRSAENRKANSTSSNMINRQFQICRDKRKAPSNMRKMRRFRSSCACAKHHSGHCSPFIHSIVSNASIS